MQNNAVGQRPQFDHKPDIRLSPIVHVEVKMPRKMLDALSIHEVNCLARGVKSVTEKEVREFLVERFGQKIADAFKPEYLFPGLTAEGE